MNVETRRLYSRMRARAWLQWSHVLMNVETSVCADLMMCAKVASMEPRPHERGNRAPLADDELIPRALQWSHVLMNVETKEPPVAATREFLASMEPRPHERGNLLRAHYRSGGQMLQWSHVLMNVETSSLPRPRRLGPTRFNGATSS